MTMNETEEWDYIRNQDSYAETIDVQKGVFIKNAILRNTIQKQSGKWVVSGIAKPKEYEQGCKSWAWER